MTKIFILLLALVALPCAAKQIYQFKDLLVLEKTENWVGLVEHLSDILPSERGEQWKALVTKALTERLSELINQADSDKTMQFLDDVVSRYPLIKSNKRFMESRGAIGLKYYAPCFPSNDLECHHKFLGFVKQDPNGEYAFSVAKQVRKRMSDLRAILYFAHAFAQKGLDSKHCEDEDLKHSVVKSLVVDGAREVAKEAKKIAFGLCFESLKTTILQAIVENDFGLSNGCKGMLEKKALLAGSIAETKCVRFVKQSSH